MKDIAKIAFFLLAASLLGALIAPELYWLCRLLGGAIPFLQNVEFHRVYDRAMLVAVVLLLYPLIRWLNMTGVRELGLERDKRAWRHLFSGAAVALCSMLAWGGLLLASHHYNVRSTVPWLKVASVFLTAAAVAVLEECLFRGALQGILERSNPAARALLFVAALYSIVHFLKPPPEPIAPQQIGWLSGFETIPKSFRQFRQPALVAGGFTTLFILGVILGATRSWTRSLWMPIGLHAGWVIGKMGFDLVAIRTPLAGGLWWGQDILSGLGPVCVLLCAGITVFGLLRLEGRQIHG